MHCTVRQKKLTIERFRGMVSYWRFTQEVCEMAAFFGGIFSGSLLLFFAG